MSAPPMSISEFVRSLRASGLMTADEIKAFLGCLSLDKGPTTVDQLVREMVSRGKLTRFQAQAVYQRKTLGLTMGNYVILDRIGRGGMGQVFKAKHRKMDRIVALKILSPAAMKSPAAVKRFHQEAKAAARLSHPNIVTAHDAGEFQGQHFLVTEYVEGETLATIVRNQGPLSLGRAVDYILQAARGLEYAHSNGVIHRDIKPSNLFLDQQGTVKILDMGIARVDEFVGKLAYGSAEEIQTSGIIIGTPDYMAPEQGQDIRVADARSDIYSLGCTLYFLLTGQVMYAGETPLEKIIAHRDHAIPFLREVRGDVPEALETVFQKMVAKRPQDRRRSMTDVIADIEKCIAARQPAAGTAASPYLLDDTVRVGGSQAAEAAPETQPVAGVGSLLDEWWTSESAQMSEQFGAPISMLSSATWRRRRRRIIQVAAAAAVLVIAVVLGLRLWPNNSRGTLEVRMSAPGGTLRVMDHHGALVIECPVAPGTLRLPIAPGEYRLTVWDGGRELFAREVTVDSNLTETVSFAPKVDGSRSPPEAKPLTPANEINTRRADPSGKPAG
jgi:hypothetical protein